MICVPSSALQAIRTHSRAAYPRECCGALLGRTFGDDGNGSREVIRLVPLANAWQGAQEHRYLVDSATVFDLERQAETDGLELIGFYHSHPDHVPIPSTFDRDHAWPWYIYMIVAVQPSDISAVRAWRLRDDRAAFHEETLTTLEDA